MAGADVNMKYELMRHTRGRLYIYITGWMKLKIAKLTGTIESIVTSSSLAELLDQLLAVSEPIQV